jgi:tRNA-specific 2-thiouridylase
VGRHQGLHLFTLGQRKGLGVASNTYKEAYVVVEKRAADKALVVAFDQPDTPGLYTSRWRVSSLSWCGGGPAGAGSLEAQPRYRSPAVPVRLTLEEGEAGILEFSKPHRAIAPGQVCAFYEGDLLLGGGVFSGVVPAVPSVVQAPLTAWR